jgi:hypothetical protein
LIDLAKQHCVAKGSPSKAQDIHVEATSLVLRSRCYWVRRDGSVFEYSGVRMFGFGIGFGLGIGSTPIGGFCLVLLGGQGV